MQTRAGPGSLALFLDDKPEPIAEGPIALQLHSNTAPREVHFKDLKLEVSPKEDELLTVK